MQLYCNHQRAALIKSLLNFIKRISNEREFAEQVRHSEWKGREGTVAGKEESTVANR